MILGVYGAGGLGRETLELARQINDATETWEKILFIDDRLSEGTYNNIEVYNFVRIYELYDKEKIEVCISIGEPALREAIAKEVTGKGYSLVKLVHPSVHVPSSALIGPGSIICAGVFISCDVRIGDNVLVQPNAGIGHDCEIGSHAVVSSFVSLSGNCSVGERAYIGMSVPVKEGLRIGNDSIIGMGSVVLRDIQDNVIAMGNPARPMKENVDKRVFR